MYAKQNNQQEFMDLTAFIRKFFPEYQVDDKNAGVLNKIGLWAARDESFNGMEQGWHIDRGILLSGPVGVGKDETFRMLWNYLDYLKSQYKFKSKVVWEFAKPFMKDGYDCFDEQTGNIYYEELALTDEITGMPTREVVNHYGTKILIGSEIINMRYNVFKKTGWQTHFSTNLNEEQLEKVYGARCMSRLSEMCNVVFIQGKDRRGLIDPAFKVNMNQPPKPPSQIDLAPQVIAENKRILDCGYVHFAETGEFPPDIHFYYDALVGFGVQVSTSADIVQYMADAESCYYEDLFVARKGPTERLEAKRAHSWKEARVIAVSKYYELLKSQGAKSIFGERVVDVDRIIEVKNDSSSEPQTERRNEV